MGMLEDELEAFKRRQKEAGKERQILGRAKRGMFEIEKKKVVEKRKKIAKSAKKLGKFLISSRGKGVRKAFGGRGPLAESPGNILLDRKPRDLFRR